MERIITKGTIMKSLFWKIMESGGVQIINFIITTILARLLTPNDYGTISLITIFITISNVIIQRGVNTSLIQKKEVDELDLSTSLIAVVFISIIMYIIIFCCSPYIAKLYRVNELTLILRVLGLTLFFGATNSIQISIISRKMEFKKIFYSNTFAMIISGVIGIVMAYCGYGVWSLVLQQLSNQIIATIITGFTLKWRPKNIFSLNRLIVIFDFGWKVLITNLITTIFLNIRGLIIGKQYGTNDLAYYNRGKQFPNLIFTIIDSSIQAVMLPIFSSKQDEVYEVKNILQKSLKISTFFIFPLMIGLLTISEELTIILLTEKWIDSILFSQIYCIIFMLLPIHTINIQVIQSLGHSDKVLKNEIIKKVVEVSILIMSLKFGVYGIAIGGIVTSIVSIPINTYQTNKILGYGMKEQIKDIIPNLLISMSMGIIIYNIKMSSIWVTLILKVIVGAIVYICAVKFLRIETYEYMINIVRDILSRNKNKKVENRLC